MSVEPAIVNAMTVDVEEHFQVSGFAGVIRRESWASMPSRVERNTERLLELFDRCQVRATFFVLGWIAERHPRLVRRLAEAGHEVASHGYGHKLIYDQQPDEFRDEVVRTKRILEDAAGQQVLGYRAASFSIGRGNLWALDVLAESGFVYDSSLFPVLHDRYGIRGAPRRIHRLKTPAGHSLVEVPPSTVAIGRATLPVAGGGYLRLYPIALSRWAVARLNLRERMPAVVYVHPWEVDPEQPRVRAPLISRFRHYQGLDTTMGKLADLMQRFRFGPMRQLVDEVVTPHAELEEASYA